MPSKRTACKSKTRKYLWSNWILFALYISKHIIWNHVCYKSPTVKNTLKLRGRTYIVYSLVYVAKKWNLTRRVLCGFWWNFIRFLLFCSVRFSNKFDEEPPNWAEDRKGNEMNTEVGIVSNEMRSSFSFLMTLILQTTPEAKLYGMKTILHLQIPCSIPRLKLCD